MTILNRTFNIGIGPAKESFWGEMRGGDDDNIKQTRHTILLFPRARLFFLFWV